MRKISNLIKINKLIALIVIIVLTILLLIAGLKFIIGYAKSDIVSDLEITTQTIQLETTNTTTTTSKNIITTKKKTTTKVNKLKIPENEITTYLYQQVIAKGWNEKDYNAAVNIIIKESNFNVYSVNSKSGACGLFQAYPCNKMKSYGSDYKTNYKVQINWGLDYIKNRYGTPVKAWNFWQDHKWY